MSSDFFTRSAYRRRNELRRHEHLFWWAVAILLLTGAAFASWLGGYYLFSHPERPKSYHLLKDVFHKIEPPKRFLITKAPRGTFYSPTKALETFSQLSRPELARLNGDLLRAYINNYQASTIRPYPESAPATKNHLPYLTGSYSILCSYPLRGGDFVPTGFVVVAQANDNPQLLIEHFFPSTPETVPILESQLRVGQALTLDRNKDLPALLHVAHTRDGRLLLSLMPLTYGAHTVLQREVSITSTLEPPETLNPQSGLPLVRGDLYDTALNTFAAHQQKYNPNAPVAYMPVAATPAPVEKPATGATAGGLEGPSGPGVAAVSGPAAAGTEINPATHPATVTSASASTVDALPSTTATAPALSTPSATMASAPPARPAPPVPLAQAEPTPASGNGAVVANTTGAAPIMASATATPKPSPGKTTAAASATGSTVAATTVPTPPPGDAAPPVSPVASATSAMASPTPAMVAAHSSHVPPEQVLSLFANRPQAGDPAAAPGNPRIVAQNNAAHSSPAPLPDRRDGNASPAPIAPGRTAPENSPEPGDFGPSPAVARNTGPRLEPFDTFQRADAPATPAPVENIPEGSWRTYAPGKMPRRLLSSIDDIEGMVRRGEKPEGYLQGDFIVRTQSNNGVTLYPTGNRRRNLRLIAAYPAGVTPPSPESLVSKDAERPFQITGMRVQSDGTVNIWVREIVRE